MHGISRVLFLSCTKLLPPGVKIWLVFFSCMVFNIRTIYQTQILPQLHKSLSIHSNTFITIDFIFLRSLPQSSDLLQPGTEGTWPACFLGNPEFRTFFLDWLDVQIRLCNPLLGKYMPDCYILEAACEMKAEAQTFSQAINIPWVSLLSVQLPPIPQLCLASPLQKSRSLSLENKSLLVFTAMKKESSDFKA